MADRQIPQTPRSLGTSAGRGSAAGEALRLLGLFWIFSFGLTSSAIAAQLKAATIEAFNHYVALTEARMVSEVQDPNKFLWVDQLPPEHRQATLEQLRQGQVMTQKLETRENGEPIPIPWGMVHHWVATVFVPGVNLAETLAQQQDYDRGAELYGPDIQDCRVLQTDGNYYRVYYRLHRKAAIVTANYNANFDIHYVPVDSTREYSISHSTRIAEVVDAGMPTENEKPVGIDHGYLWRLYTYTRYEERDGGVYIQTEFVALSRSVPAIFAWLVNPYIRSIPQDYLIHLLGATRNDLMEARLDGTHVSALRPQSKPLAGTHPASNAGAVVNMKSY